MELISQQFEIIIHLAKDEEKEVSTVGWKVTIGQTQYGRYMEIAKDAKALELNDAVTAVVHDMLQALRIPDDLRRLQLTAGIEPEKFNLELEKNGVHRLGYNLTGTLPA